MSEYELEFGDANDLANVIRNAIGVGNYEKVNVIFPQFDRTDCKAISPPPDNTGWLDTLKTAPVEILRDLGLQLWSDESNLWLFPAEWYDYIPDGYEVVDISDNTEKFQKGVTDDDRRFGALAFGIIAKGEPK
jgi:hypothetical protein